MVSSGLRWLGIAGVVTALAWLCLQHEHGGMKGSYVPVGSLTFCIICAAAAAMICKRHWLFLAAPFVAGVVGAIAIGPFASPFGGVVGLVVGFLVVLLPT